MNNKAQVLITGEDKTKDAFASLRSNVREAQAGFSQLMSVVGGAGTAVAGLVSAVAGASAFYQFVQSIQRMDQIQDLSEKLAVGTDTLQELAYAGQLSGTSLDGLAAGNRRLQLTMQEAATGGKEQVALFKALGVEVTAANGNLRSAEEVMGDLADVFAGMEDGATKTAVAVELFGNRGAELIPFLNQGRSGIRDLTDEARQLGAVMDKEALEAAAEFNDQMDRLSTVAQAAANEVTSELLPAINDLIERFIQGKKAGGDFWEALFGSSAITLNRAFGESYGEQIRNITEEIDALQKRRNPLDSRGTDDAIATLERRRKALQGMQALLALEGSEGGAYQDARDRQAAGGAQVNSAMINTALNAERAREEAAKAAQKARDEAAKKSYDEALKSAQALAALRNAEYEEVDRYLQQQEAERVATVKAANDAVTAAQQEYDAFALSRSQLEQLTIMRLRDKAAALEVGSEARKAIEQEIEARDKLSDIFRKGESRDAVVKEQERIAAESQKIWDNFGENVQRNLGDGLYDAMQGNFKSIGDGFKSMLQRMLSDALAANLSKAMFGGTGGAFGADGLLGLAIKGIGLIGGGPTYETGGFAGSQWSEGIGMFAQGGVFSGGRVIPFANGGAFTNGVVSEPTLAPMALFGEAGPEAIMPLARGANGSLGVRASGGSSTTVQQHFTIQIDGTTDMERNKAMIQQATQRAVAQGNAALVERLSRERKL